MATTFVPAEVFPPGEFIREQLKARGWTQNDLADVMERPIQVVSEIILAKKRVTEETAKELEAALGVDAEFWLNTEALYRLRHGEPAPSGIARRAAIRKRVPLRFMAARGWLPITDDINELEGRVVGYLGVSSLNERQAFARAAKQTDYDSELTPIQEVWLLRAKRLAETQLTPAYSSAKLREAVNEMRGLLRSPDDARHVPTLLNRAGVRFVVVERLPGLGIDGVCFWLSPTQPVIVMSLTRDRIDNFWFVLRHEIEHVLNGDGKAAAIIDNDLDSCQSVTEQERAANAAAADFCVPKDEMDSFVKRKAPLFNDTNIRQFAQSIGLHSGLVAGQLRKRLSDGPRGEQAWKLFTSHLAKIRHVVLGTALVDGFGNIPQMD
jgi:HTH-type transcriptional regulator/antitoxin HigA